MARRKQSMTVFLEPEQLRDLRALAEVTRVPQSSLLRDALQALLDSRRSEIPDSEPDPRQENLDL